MDLLHERANLNNRLIDFECASGFIFIQLTSVKLLYLFIFLYLKLELSLLRFYCSVIIFVKRFYP